MASLNVHASSNSHHRSVEQSLSGPNYSPGYGPPHTGHVALSQPERPSYQDRNHHYQSDPPHSYSLSQDDVENDLYSTPVDQLPPSAGTRIIAPKKKLGVCERVCVCGGGGGCVFVCVRYISLINNVVSTFYKIPFLMREHGYVYSYGREHPLSSNRIQFLGM